jgi:hypothetical protein
MNAEQIEQTLPQFVSKKKMEGLVYHMTSTHMMLDIYVQ